MNDIKNSLKDRCHVATGQDGNRFVGIKADTENVAIYFPIGWNLPDDETALRQDIKMLFNILCSFMKNDDTISARDIGASQNVEFPIHAYLKIIERFLNDGKYYVEFDSKYKVGANGQISWARTLRTQKGFIKDGNLVFINTVARHLNPDSNRQITQIHKFCVYEAFDKLGWLYIVNKPELPGTHPSIKESIQILNKKLSDSHKDSEQELFFAMLNMLKYLNEQDSSQNYLFGTNYFERIWEKMIDKAFGIENKSKFFPKTHWLLDRDKNVKRGSLFPDSIMICNGKVYVLDAKYYKYGQTGRFDDLPSSADINKQITYGEYIAQHLQISNERLFNAFLLPYNMDDNKFGFKSAFENFGEAIGDWKSNANNYERIQGIVIDTKFLMYNYLTISEDHKHNLARVIERISN